jgi:HAD superfamily hydrolase (TIGR01509 family)
VLPAALVFDFDGLICDTESAEYEAVRRVFLEHGVELALEDWLPAVGAVTPDWVSELEGRAGRRLDRDVLVAARRAHSAELLTTVSMLSGVAALVAQAHGAGVPCGLASNSPAVWVEGHLARLGLTERFDVVVTADRVARPKPDPEPYLAAVDALRAAPVDSVALEDSSVGIESARAAGLFTVAVPGPMSAHHDFEPADLVVTSLADVTLDDLGRALASRRVG